MSHHPCICEKSKCVSGLLGKDISRRRQAALTPLRDALLGPEPCHGETTKTGTDGRGAGTGSGDGDRSSPQGASRWHRAAALCWAPVGTGLQELNHHAGTSPEGCRGLQERTGGEAEGSCAGGGSTGTGTDPAGSTGTVPSLVGSWPGQQGPGSRSAPLP